MRKNRNLYLLTIIALLFNCCIYKVDKFTPDELMWYKPFEKTDTVIFLSENSEVDTIIFRKNVAETNSTNNFEQGFSKTNFLTVSYDFTKGSYHQFALMGPNGKRYKQDLLNVSKNSSGYGTFEITFIGTIFNKEQLKKVKIIAEETYFFDSNKAAYSGMNVEKGIKNFTFNTNFGILKYTDSRNIEWERK